MCEKTYQNSLPDSINFDILEQEVLTFWRQNNCFKRSLELSNGLKEFRFYDGPPFATGLPHYGHILAGSLKDAITRYAHQTGHHVPRAFGWDCHGLPVECEIDKQLNIKNRDEIINKIGIAQYNEHCRAIVMKYSNEWEATVERIGRWIDFRSGYKTMNFPYMESVWWIFGQLYKKGLVYRDYKVMPYSTACSTPLSNFEAGQNYKDMTDPSIIVAFPIREYEKIAHPNPERDVDPEVLKLVPAEILNNSEILAWTTTPWTLPANMGLAMHPTLTYSCFRVLSTGRLFWVADSRADAVLKDLKLIQKNTTAHNDDKSTINPLYEWVCKGIPGSAFAEICIKPPYTTFWREKTANWPRAWRIACDNYVTDDTGTGTVHCAPCYGEDDYRVGIENGFMPKKGAVALHVDENGCLDPKIIEEEDLKGLHVKAADKVIRQHLKERGLLLADGSIVHSCPHCWRSDTPLIYRAVPSWFISVSSLRDKLLESNLTTYWVPQAVQERRFHNWLADARDWCVSRNRFWGTPIPLWVSEDGEIVRCISSVEELKEATGCKESIEDLHRHFIDHLTIPDPRGSEYPPLKRVEEVFDCWFESGSMPYASIHYPFENKDKFKACFPADFVGEGLDQTRGWFYTMTVLGVALFDKAPFKNVIVNGLVLAEDGKKMSKRLKNYPDPAEILETYGADALRIYLISSPALRAESLRFKQDGLKEIMKTILLPWYHSLRFLCQEVTRFELNNDRQKFSSTFADKANEQIDDLNDMDHWIISMVNSLVKYVHQEMSAYRLYSACANLLQFMDQLTNWYVRLNRERMRASGSDESKESRRHAQVSLSVLHHVLSILTILMAPFTPFMAEFSFKELSKIKSGDFKLVLGPDQKLKENEPLSVHYCMLPTSDVASIDTKLEQRVSDLQQVITIGRLLRERKRMSIKQCVSDIIVKSGNIDFVNNLNQSGAMNYVRRELNTLEFKAIYDADSVKMSVLPNLRVLGQRLGAKLRTLQPSIKALSEEEIKSYMLKKTITIAGETLGADDLLVTLSPVGAEETDNLAVECGPDFLILMNIELNDELRAINLARDVTTRIQKLRKECGLKFDDDANTTFILEEDEIKLSQLEAVLDTMQTMIKRKLSVCKELPVGRKILGRSQNIVIFAD